MKAENQKKEESGLIEKADRPEARLGYRPPEEYGGGGSKVKWE